MSPAELTTNESLRLLDIGPKGYSGRNMTLPASWWTSTSFFQLERRAIFAKVSFPFLYKW